MFIAEFDVSVAKFWRLPLVNNGLALKYIVHCSCFLIIMILIE